MRFVPLLLLFGLACAGTALAPGRAFAQTTVDPRALEPLQPQSPAPASEPARPTHPAAHPAHRAHPHAASHPATAAKPAAPSAAAPSPAPAPAPPQVRVPLAAPPPPELPPALAVPTRPPPPPSPAPIADDAPSAATPIADGLRITFGDGRADLNPGTEAALRALAHDAKPDSTFAVTAFAPGTAEDPSTPRRLSLARALTARAVLIAQGIESVRIYVKALGAGAGIAEGPPDRADVTVAATTPQAKSTP